MSTHQGPVTHRRRPGWPSRVARRVSAVLLILLTLALGFEIVVRTPDQSVTAGYFLKSGGLGDRVQTLDFAATVVGVRGGRAVIDDEGVEAHTDGVWILVRLKVESLKEPEMLAYAAIHDRRGRTLEATSRVEHPMENYWYEPGLPVDGELLFEVPRDAVPDARLRLYHQLMGDHRFQTMADIDLGLTESTLDGWLREDEPMRIRPPEVVL